MVVIQGLLVWWRLILISKVCASKNIYVYSDLITEVYGKPLSIIYNLVVIIYTFGVLILNQTIIFTLLGEAIFKLFYYDKYISNEHFLTESFWSNPYIKYTLLYVINLCIIFPLCLIKNVSGLKSASLIEMIVFISIIFLIIIKFPFYLKYYK